MSLDPYSNYWIGQLLQENKGHQNIDVNKKDVLAYVSVIHLLYFTRYKHYGL